MYSSFVTTSYTYRLCLALCLHLACACFVAKVVRRAEAGWRRVCAVTPVLAVNCLLPAVFHDTDEVVTKSMLLICLFWLSNFKALALCLDRGPLLKQHSLNRFLVVYLIPIVLGNSKAERSQTSQVRSASTYTAGSHGGQTSNFGRPFLAKAVVLACMTFTLINYGDSLSTWSTHILYAISMYTCMGGLYDGFAMVMMSVLRFEVLPVFDKPFLAESFSSFWQKRWNLCMGNTVRDLIYEPIQEGQLVKSKAKSRPPSVLRRWFGVCAGFLVSGLMHEATYWYGNNMHTRNWCWLLFFVLQGVFVGLEGFGKTWLKQSGVTMPHGLAVGITVSLQMWLAHILFFPAVTDAELNVKVYAALLGSYRFLCRCVT